MLPNSTEHSPSREAKSQETASFLRNLNVCIKLNAYKGTRYRSWLRHNATSRKVAGSNPDEVDFFNLPNPSSHTMALGSTQPLTEMSTRNLTGGKVAAGS